MLALGPRTTPLQDLPVCFPDRPCVDYPPYEADGINLTSGLTAASEAIAIACFAVLAVAVLLVVLGLRSRRLGPSLAVVGLSATLVATGAVVAGLVDLRLGAISAIYGWEGPGSPDLYGSWWLVGMAGHVMAFAGFVGLVTAALFAIVRLQNVLRTGRDPVA